MHSCLLRHQLNVSKDRMLHVVRGYQLLYGFKIATFSPMWTSPAARSYYADTVKCLLNYYMQYTRARKSARATRSTRKKTRSVLDVP